MWIKRFIKETNNKIIDVIERIAERIMFKTIYNDIQQLVWKQFLFGNWPIELQKYKSIKTAIIIATT